MTASVKVTHVWQAGLSSGVTCLLSSRVCSFDRVRSRVVPAQVNTNEENTQEEDFAVKRQAC